MTMQPIILSTAQDARAQTSQWRNSAERIALVPTMGALHAGHLKLVEVAKETADRVVVSIFVNPTQFAEGEDFGDYPRTWDTDIAALTRMGVDAIYAPAAQHMYPEGYCTSVHVAGPAEELETTHRPHFFSGVATVVSKLIIGVMPDTCMFGEKDYQQLLVVKRMTQDLQLPCTIQGVETVRELDGLALSSRNSYLSEKERAIAPKLQETLQQCADEIRRTKASENALNTAKEKLTEAGFVVDYVALRNAQTLAAVEDIGSEPLRLLAAAHLGTTRLIDNIAV